MKEWLDFLSANPIIGNILISLLVIIVLIYIIAFLQGRDISFYPPKIGKKPIRAGNSMVLPTAPETPVNRQDYIQEVIDESLKPGNKKIILLSSGLKSSRLDPTIANLQETWANLKDQVNIKVLAQLNDENIQGACELLAKGIDVRFVSSTGIDYFSFHVFRGSGMPRVIINRKNLVQKQKNEAPILFSNVALARVMEEYFEDLWSKSTEISEVLASKVLSETPLKLTNEQLESSLRDLECTTEASKELLKKTRFRVKAIQSFKYIFVLGLPGSGKTTLVSRLARILSERNIQSITYTDYPILYEQFLADTLGLGITRESTNSRFIPDKYGGFEILDDKVLMDTIHIIKENCLPLFQSREIVIIEFAREKNLEALKAFGSKIVDRSQIIYVKADERERIQRIMQRVKPIQPFREGEKIIITASDNHYISEHAINRLYSSDDIEDLISDNVWGKKVHVLDTNIIKLPNLKKWIREFLSEIET